MAGVTLTKSGDVSAFAGLEKLQWLELRGTYVSDLTPLAGIESLQMLDLTPATSPTSSPWPGSDLRVLELDSTKISDLSPLAGLKKLGELGLVGTPVSDTQVKSLQQDLPFCSIIQ